jgi:hypothetical protein
VKRNRFTDEQIIGILKEHEPGTQAGLGAFTGDVLRRCYGSIF